MLTQEKFEPPTWDKFKDDKYFLFYSNEHKCFSVEIVLSIDISTENESEEYIAISDVNDFNHNMLFKEKLNKENYIKAVEYARKLFLGEEV